jgi:predicted SAM-dependent methyltransferase
MKLNIGCGPDLRPGWLNVDSRRLYPEGATFCCCDLLDLDARIDDNSCEEIAALDVLEHSSWRELDAVLTMLARKLRPGGVLFVQAPDLEKIAAAYLQGTLDHHGAQRLLYGDQGYPENTHRNIWSPAEAVRRLQMVGLQVERLEHINYNVQVWGRRLS